MKAILLAFGILAALAHQAPWSEARAHEAQTSAVEAFAITLFDIWPDRADDAALLLAAYAGSLASTPGCLRAELMRQPEPTSNHFALVAVWRRLADRDRHLSGDAHRRFLDGIQSIAASPVDDREYGKLDP